MPRPPSIGRPASYWPLKNLFEEGHGINAVLKFDRDLEPAIMTGHGRIRTSFRVRGVLSGLDKGGA